MSLSIREETITAVLLTDGWHEVKPGTFYLDAYEYLDGEHLSHGGGHSGICATGFAFVEKGTAHVIAGPLTSIQAVRHTP